MRAAWQRIVLLVLVSALGGCALLTAPSLDSLKEPTLRLRGLAVKDINVLAPSFLVRLQIDNPNDVGLSLAGIDAALKLGGQAVAAGVSRSPVELKRLGSSEVDLEIQANTLGVLRQLLQLDGQGTMDYIVDGHLSILNWLGPLGRLPFQLTGNVTRDDLLKELNGAGVAF